MMLQTEKETSNAIAFNVELPNTGSNQSSKSPEIKKKLEEARVKAAHGPSITLEQIAEKLKRAEEKRRQTLLTMQSSSTEERRRNVQEKKRSLDRAAADQIMDRLEKNLNRAEEKRMSARERRQQKLRQHISKVEDICKEQAVRR